MLLAVLHAHLLEAVADGARPLVRGGDALALSGDRLADRLQLPLALGAQMPRVTRVVAVEATVWEESRDILL